MGKILGSIARDYNGILALIEGHAHILARQLESDSSVDALNQNSLSAIVDATERGGELTRRLIQLGEFPPDPAERSDLVSVVRNNQILMRSVLGSGAEINLHLPAHEIYIPLCEEGVTQILIGCILDARARHAGQVSVSVSIMEKRAMLHFTDNGIELHNRVADQLSDEWQMVNEWVRMGGGKMQHGVHLSSGGDVMVALPLAIQSANPFAEKTVLVVDDGDGLPDLVEQHLHAFGVRVLRAANAEQALVVQQQQAQPVDVLLTNLGMPELNNVRLAEMLVADNPKLRVVYLTGDAVESDQMSDTGLADILKNAITVPKPVSLRGLSLSLERALQSVQNMDDPMVS